jgi:murein L,D-transpeptidase YafK
MPRFPVRRPVPPLLGFLLLTLLATPSLGFLEPQDVWLLVDTEALVLEVKTGDRTVERFEKIAIGRGGAGADRVRGDDRTPLGKYRVAWFNPNSRFRFFIGLDFPLRSQVERAYRRGLLSETEYNRLKRALYQGGVPPQDSPLGGQIGIHGLGQADRRLHDLSNWTEGCVALTNEQIERLRSYVRIGTTVVIR